MRVDLDSPEHAVCSQQMKNLHDNYSEWKARADKAEARVAELEAALEDATNMSKSVVWQKLEALASDTLALANRIKTATPSAGPAPRCAVHGNGPLDLEKDAECDVCAGSGDTGSWSFCGECGGTGYKLPQRANDGLPLKMPPDWHGHHEPDDRGPEDLRTDYALPGELVDQCREWLTEHAIERADGDLLVGTSRATALALAKFVRAHRSETPLPEPERTALGVIATFSTDEWSRQAAKMALAGEVITRDKPGRSKKST